MSRARTWETCAIGLIWSEEIVKDIASSSRAQLEIERFADPRHPHRLRIPGRACRDQALFMKRHRARIPVNVVPDMGLKRPGIRGRIDRSVELGAQDAGHLSARYIA